MSLRFVCSVHLGEFSLTNGCFLRSHHKQFVLVVFVFVVHNIYLLFYAHSLCLIDQTQTFSLAHRPIYVGLLLFCGGSRLKKVNKKDRTMSFKIILSIKYDYTASQSTISSPLFKPSFGCRCS